MRSVDMSYLPVYPGGDKQLLPDLITLANAYLAEHPADDGEPVTEKWASNLSDRQELNEGDAIWILGLSDTGRSVSLINRMPGNFWCVSMGGVKINMVATRGDVRRLCAALCAALEIPLPEVKQ